MKKMIALLALALPLMGASCQEQLQSVAVRGCKALVSIYAHYDGLADSGAIPASYMKNVAVVRAQFDRGCANPSALTTVQLTKIAGQSYIALRAAFAAGAGQGAEDYDAEQGLAKLENLRRMVDAARRN